MVLGTETLNIAVIPKEVQMPPGQFMEIMLFAKSATDRTRKISTPLCLDLDMQYMRLYISIQYLANYPPWTLYT
jgi:hypothetical protein